jgi:cyclopropane-fatty-acyl-phospholipid synthase
MSSYLPKAITRPIGHGSDLIRQTIGGLTWGPAVSVSKAAVTSLLARIETGTLIIIDDVTGERQIHGQPLAKESTLTNGVNGSYRPGPRRVELKIKKETFWVRLALFGDMGFAEAYMLGEVEVDLVRFFEVRLQRQDSQFKLPKAKG